MPGVLDGMQVLDYGRVHRRALVQRDPGRYGCRRLARGETGGRGGPLGQGRHRRWRGRHLPAVQPQQAVADTGFHHRRRGRRSPVGWWPARISSSPICRPPGCGPAVWTTRRYALVKPDIILASATAYGGRPVQRQGRLRRGGPGHVGCGVPAGPAANSPSEPWCPTPISAPR